MTNLRDVDSHPQSIVSFGQDLVEGQVLPFHRHQRSQFVYASEGIMAVATRSASFVIPPHRAVWIPGSIEHRIEARDAVKMRTLYFDKTREGGLPGQVQVMQVSALLRELILEAVSVGNDYSTDSAAARLMPVILDQVRSQAMAPSLVLPMPDDSRLKVIVQALIDNPADARELTDWAGQAGASVRTLVRLFPAQTGMSFREWRQQRRLLRALELLAAGESVTSIALEVGYTNTSAFIAMFHRCMGVSPTRYL